MMPGSGIQGSVNECEVRDNFKTLWTKYKMAILGEYIMSNHSSQTIRK